MFPRGFVAAALAVAAGLASMGNAQATSQSGPSYQLQQLGPVSTSLVPPSGSTRLVALNNRGDVLGVRTNSSGLPDAAIWHDQVWSNLPLQSSASAGILPYAFNDHNQTVVRVLAGSNGIQQIVVITGGQLNWTGLPSSSKAVATGINDSGDVVGHEPSGGTTSGVEWTSAVGHYDVRTVAGASFAAIDRAGRIAGTAVSTSGRVRGLATLWLPNGTAIRLDPTVPSPTPASHCTAVTYRESPTSITYVSANGVTRVDVVGTAATSSSDCSGWSSSTTSQAELWQISLRGSSVVAKSQRVIGFQGEDCSEALSITPAGRVLAKCPSGAVIWQATSSSLPIETVMSRTEPQGWNARSVLSINHHGQVLVTGFSSSAGPTQGLLMTPSPNPFGTTFVNSFDSQHAGALTTGPAVNQFSFVEAPSGLTVENSYFDTAPNALQVTVGAAPSVYARKDYGAEYSDHQLSFSMVLASNFQLAASGFAAISSTETGSTSSSDGLVELVIGSNMKLFVTYIDTSGIQRYLYTNVTLARETPYNFKYEEDVTNGSGSLSLDVNGASAIDAEDLALPSSGVELFKVGDVYTPAGTGSGSIYFDDVVAQGS